MNASWANTLYTNVANGTARASFTSETSLFTGLAELPTIPQFWFDQAYGKALRLVAWGIVGCTGTPTYTFQGRISTTGGPGTLSGSSIGVSAAITMQSGVTAQLWELGIDMICTVPGQGTGNTTLNCKGWVESPGGFAAPYKYEMPVTNAPTWTQTIDCTLAQYLNLSVSCSASSASNTITLQGAYLLALN